MLTIGRISILIFLLASAGCSPGDSPRFRAGSPKLLKQDTTVPLSRVLRVRLDRPARLEVRLTDSRGERLLSFKQKLKRHDVPLLGLRARDRVTVVVTAIDGAGRAKSTPQHFRVGALPERFPIIDVLANEPDLMEPGLLFFPVELVSDDERVPWMVAVDESREPVWIWEAPHEYGVVRMHDSGSLYAVSETVAWEISPLGEVLGQWGEKRQKPASSKVFVETEVGSLHHELLPMPDAQRFLALSKRVVKVDDYPCSYTQPTKSCGSARIEDTMLVQFNREGDVLLKWSMTDRLDTFRIGYDALDKIKDGERDWSHGNAAIPMPGGGFLISIRHQDALVALNDDGDIRWILSDPSGWHPDFEDLLLEPVGEDFRWSYHQHGPVFDDDGILWLFDNGNEGGTPYTGKSAHIRSRVVAYDIDEEAGTVAQVAEFSETATGQMYSRALGNSFVMPTTGNVMGVYGMPTDQDGEPHAAFDFGSRAARMVEWTLNGELASDFRVRSDRDVEPKGWRSYRAVHANSLYPAGVETWLE